MVAMTANLFFLFLLFSTVNRDCPRTGLGQSQREMLWANVADNPHGVGVIRGDKEHKGFLAIGLYNYISLAGIKFTGGLVNFELVLSVDI
jgi:hypothetical protein